MRELGLDGGWSVRPVVRLTGATGCSFSILFVPGFSSRSFRSRRCLRFSTLIVVFQFRVPLFGLALALWGFCFGVGLGYSRVS